MRTILLVDDNPLRASMRKSALVGAREVVRVLDAAEALCLIELPEFAQSLSLLITGHVTTGLSGPEFVAEVRSRLPEVPVLVLAVGLNSKNEYLEIAGVQISETTSPGELRLLVQQMVQAGERRVS